MIKTYSHIRRLAHSIELTGYTIIALYLYLYCGKIFRNLEVYVLGVLKIEFNKVKVNTAKYQLNI